MLQLLFMTIRTFLYGGGGNLIMRSAFSPACLRMSTFRIGHMIGPLLLLSLFLRSIMRKLLQRIPSWINISRSARTGFAILVDTAKRTQPPAFLCAKKLWRYGE
jgi:hypothetical protein